MAEEIVLDDLAAPKFSPEARAVLDAAAVMAEGLELTESAILGQASDELGLDDFGGDGFRAPLAVLLGALQGVERNRFGTLNLHSQLVQLAKNRLLLADLLRRHPEIHDIPVRTPIVIAGLPRTGTTHLHNLLSADPALRSLPYWESLEPVPTPGESAGADGPDPRIARATAATEFMDLVMPHFRAMHEMTAEHVHEEIQLLALDYSTMYFETQALLPSYRDHYLAADQTPYYRNLRTTLQALTFLRGGDRWVLKSPQHLEQFAALRTVFPDATVVVTHRDPVAVTASMVAMLTYAARMACDRPDPVAIGAYWADRLRTMLLACVRDRDLLDDGPAIDVRFDDFMADDLGTVAHLYDLAGQPLDERARWAHAGYLADHRRNRHGRIRYALEPFGLDAEQLREDFAPYTERFGLTSTWTG